MSAPQIEHRSDLALPDRAVQLIFAQLGGSVEGAFLYRVEIALYWIAPQYAPHEPAVSPTATIPIFIDRISTAGDLDTDLALRRT